MSVKIDRREKKCGVRAQLDITRIAWDLHEKDEKVDGCLMVGWLLDS